MAGLVTDTVANAALGAIVGDDHTISAATLYFALSTTVPSLSGGAITGVTEPEGATTDAGYARVAVTNSDAQFTIAARVAENDNSIEWPEATEDYSDDVVAVVAYTASTAGTALWWGELTAPLTVLETQSVRVQPGNLTLTVPDA